jgi:16S rRNA (adenine1518-N6/adenine1519-N6)-dimethyltransferase
MIFKPKKSLGQNFLKSKAALNDIVEAANISDKDIVIEIGPGKGVLTKLLLEKSGKVIAIEKDDRLIEVLSETFKDAIGSKKLELIHGDILEFEPSKYGLKSGEYKLVANIPYYITGLVIQQFLTSETQPTLMVLLLQKEVAQRIVTRDKRESILSVSVKVYGNPYYIGTVKAKYFSPEPKVDSAIILVDDISKEFFTRFSERDFFDVVKAGFAHKRKVVISNLKKIFPEKDFEKIFDDLLLNRKIRAENLTIEQWKEITIQMMEQHQ